MAHYFSNSQIAELLRNVASALQLASEDQNRFRIIAYHRAADAIEHASSDIKDLWDDQQLDQISGIGESIASYLDELFRTGKVRHFQSLLKTNPPAFYQMLKIPGIGPQTAIKLTRELGITKKAGWLGKLQKAATKHRVPEHLEKSILSFSDDPKRLFIHQAVKISDDILNYLRQCPQVIDCQVLGSLRRQVSTVGDIDIAASTQIPVSVIEYFCRYPKKDQVFDAGNTQASISLVDGLRIDLITTPPQAYGNLLQHLTGSKHHNIALREYALKHGWSMSELGIKSTAGIQTFSDEKSLYRFLGLDYIPPELRENRGEIQSAQNHSLPKLVELTDLKGDLHLHTSFDVQTNHDLGQHPLSTMIDKANSLGYAYIGITEHNPSFSNHTPSQYITILKKKKEMVDYFNENESSPVYVFNGLEVDIRTDGSLAMPAKAIDLLDYLIVSIHSGFNQTRKTVTDRIISALSHPKAKIFGHPTGRLLQEREGLNIDWDRLFEYCQAHQKILEIDSWPNRLDLPDNLVFEAVKRGVKISIDSDAHSHEQMDLLIFGVSTARRGWAKKSDIINTLDLSSLKEVIYK